MGEEHELKGLGSLGKKTPFYRTSQFQPLCAQVVHKRYYRLEERYYRLARLKQPNERENTSFWSRAEVATEVAAVVLFQEVVPLPRAVVKNYIPSKR